MAAVINTFTDTITTTYIGNGKSVTVPVGTYTGSKDAGVAIVATAGTTDVAVSISFTGATIQSVVMSTDQDLTVKVNSSSAPTETFTIKKTAGLIWGSDFTSVNPFGSTVVTTFYITNAGVVDAKFNFRCLYN